MPNIDETFDVTKFDKSREDNTEQAENILSIFSTFDVSNPDKFNEGKDQQL